MAQEVMLATSPVIAYPEGYVEMARAPKRQLPYHT